MARLRGKDLELEKIGKKDVVKGKDWKELKVEETIPKEEEKQEEKHYIREKGKKDLGKFEFDIAISFAGDPIEPAKKMQQGSDLLSLCFINDFHWRQKQNKGKQNKRSALVLENSTSLSRLS